MLGTCEDGPLWAQKASSATLVRPCASLLSLRHVHLVFIQTLSSSYNVQDVKRRSLSRLKPVPKKFKPVLTQFHTVPIQFLTRQLRSNKFLLSPAHSHCVPTASLSSLKLIFHYVHSDYFRSHRVLCSSDS